MVHPSTMMYLQTWILIFTLIFMNISGDGKSLEQIEDEFVKEHPEPEVKSKFTIADISLHKLESHCLFAFGEQPVPTAISPFTIKLRNVIFNHTKVDNKLMEVIQCALAKEFIRESIVYNCLYLLKEGTGDVLSFEGEKCYPEYELYDGIIDENKWKAKRAQTESFKHGDSDDDGHSFISDKESNLGDYVKPIPSAPPYPESDPKPLREPQYITIPKDEYDISCNIL